MIMKKYLILFLSVIIAQNPISDPGENIATEPGFTVTLSGSNSYDPENEDEVLTFQWTVPQDILDANPGLDLNSETLEFIAPTLSSSATYSISLQVTDSDGNTSQEYDSNTLLLTDYCDATSGASDRYLELYNGTGQTITSSDWESYQVWMGRNNADFMNPDEDFWRKLLFRPITESDLDHGLEESEIAVVSPPELPHGEVLVIAKDLEGANPLITGNEYVIIWDGLSKLGGDDGIALAKDDENGDPQPVDVIGASDDGEWDVAGVEEATQNHTLVRKSKYAIGNYPNWEESAGTNAEDSQWIVLEGDDFSSAGNHSCTACDSVVEVLVVVRPTALPGENIASTCDEIVYLEGDASGGSPIGGEYSYSWDMVYGTCSNQEVLNDDIVSFGFTNEEDCEDEGYTWTDAEWYDGSCYSKGAGFIDSNSGASYSEAIDGCNNLYYCNWTSEDFTDCNTDTVTINDTEFAPMTVCSGDVNWDESYGNGVYDCLDLDENGTINTLPADQGGECEPFLDCDEESGLCDGDDGWNSITMGNTRWGDCGSRLRETESATPNFTSPTNLEDDSKFYFSLVVSDGNVPSNASVVSADIEANLCPKPNAGGDRRYRLDAVNTVVLYGDESYDPNTADDIQTYTWEQIGPVDINGNILDELIDGGIYESSNSQLTLSNLPTSLPSNPTNYEFALRVTDSQGKVSENSDTVSVTIADFEAPATPNLYAVAYSDYVKLSWDFVAENSIDPLSQYADFEGYKLYRSEDGGQTWCAPDKKTYDFNGNEVGCEPLAQFDLKADLDEKHCMYKPGYSGCDKVRGEVISGYDPTDGWVYLGDNSGVSHIYIDEDVINGLEYTYTLTAYDMGVRTYNVDYLFVEDSIESGEPYVDTLDGEYDEGEEFTDCGVWYICDVDDTANDSCDADNIGAECGENGECVEAAICDGDDNWDASYGNGEWDEGEDFVDSADFSDPNGQYDEGEEFTDLNENGIWDGTPIYSQETLWSVSNPDQWTSIGKAEQFTDLNSDGVCSGAEQYVDENGNGEWDSVISTEEGIYYSLPPLESSLGELGDANFVQAIPGGLPSNISDPLPDEADTFILADSENIGNADRFFDIVDKSLIENKLIKFEVQAEYNVNQNGIVEDSFEGIQSQNPTLYAWEVDANGWAVNPYETPVTAGMTYSDVLELADYGLPGWGPSLNSVDDYVSFLQQLINTGMFGFSANVADLSDEQEEIIQNVFDNPTEDHYALMLDVFFQEGVSFLTPDYLVDGMEIKYADVDGAAENWTDLIYGVRFKFDNSFLEFSSTAYKDIYVPDFVELYTVESDSDSSLMQSLFISSERSTEIMYADNNTEIFQMRPPYKYMIEFDSEPNYPAGGMLAPPTPWDGWDDPGVAGSCTSSEGITNLPFRVKNLTTNEWVSLMHRDYGLNDGYSTDSEGNTAVDDAADGRKDCFWTRSELVSFNEQVSTYSQPNQHQYEDYTYTLNLDYFMFREFGTDDWNASVDYLEGDQVLYQSMIWEASSFIPNNIAPPSGSTGEGRSGWFDCGSDLKCDEDEEGYSGIGSDPSGDNYDSSDNPDGTEGDGINDNPWTPKYPWKAGDRLYFTPKTWYADGDNWTVDLSDIGEESSVNDDLLADVYVVPNPYRGGSSFNQVYDDETIYFKGLPNQCEISIYTVTGKLVDKIVHNSNVRGEKEWHLENSDGEKIGPGLYIYYVESGNSSFAGKFAVVR